jgi:CubicO group peptidase (beta-lactamase class C family)
MTPDHLFMVGSIVKMFTKIAIFRLQDMGLLDINDPLYAHLPGVPDDKKGITIVHLLKHQSGLPDFVNEQGDAIDNNFANLQGEEEVDWDYVPTTRQEITERGLKATLLFEPGTDTQYSNLGYGLLASLIVEKTGQDYEAFIRDNVFRPAGMTHTGSVLPDWSGLPRTEGCAGGNPWPMPFFIGRWMADGPSWNNRGNGGMMGTMADLVNFVNGIRDNVFFDHEAVYEAYRDHQIGTSNRFKERAAAAFGGNGIYNAYYYWLAESDLKLISFSTRAENDGESYLSDFLGFIETYLDSAKPN